MADLDFVGGIKRCKAVLLVAQALPAVAELDFRTCWSGDAEVPEKARRVVAFMRVWCLVSRCPPFSLARLPVPLLRSGGEEPWRVHSLLTAVCCDRQVELMAARDNKILVVMRCGVAERDASAGDHKFVDDFKAMNNLEWLVDVMKAFTHV